jgi:hypothetical protein
LGQFYKSFNGRNLPEPSTEKEKVYLAWSCRGTAFTSPD